MRTRFHRLAITLSMLDQHRHGDTLRLTYAEAERSLRIDQHLTEVDRLLPTGAHR